jgi:triosephosphate isomerase (TIM)
LNTSTGNSGKRRRKPAVIGNWKMNGDIRANEHLLTSMRTTADRAQIASQVDIGVSPPFLYLGQTSTWLGDTEIQWGAQDVCYKASGAYTGEVSAMMLADLGCRFALVGHSERRAMFGETDEMVAAKVAQLLTADLTAVICVGETLEEREAGITESVLVRQIDAVSEVIKGSRHHRVIIAYEPVWAIGTGRTATPLEAQQAHAAIRLRLGECGVSFADDLRILYGGSLKPSNAAELFSMADVDGGLIGGASLLADDFFAICRAAARM